MKVASADHFSKKCLLHISKIHKWFPLIVQIIMWYKTNYILANIIRTHVKIKDQKYFSTLCNQAYQNLEKQTSAMIFWRRQLPVFLIFWKWSKIFLSTSPIKMLFYLFSTFQIDAKKRKREKIDKSVQNTLILKK